MSDRLKSEESNTRRSFLKKSSAVAAAASLPMVVPRNVHSEQPVKQDVLNIGLVGTGGRGTGAVTNSL